MRDRSPSASRRQFLRGSFATLATAFVAGCDRLGDTGWFDKLLRSGESLARRPEPTRVNNGDLDPGRDFVITATATARQ